MLVVYLAALWQLLVNTVYTRCSRLLELSSLLCGSFLLKLLVFRCAHFIVSYAVLYLGVCVCLCAFMCFMFLLPFGVLNKINNNMALLA